MVTKIGFCVDIHDHFHALQTLLELNAMEHLVICGDMIWKKNLEQTNNFIKSLKKQVKLHTLPAKEPIGIVRMLEEEGVSFHGKVLKIGKWNIVGYGGETHTVYPDGFTITEDELRVNLPKLFNGLDMKKTILATHLPPKNTKIDFTSGREHVGSQAIREIIEKYQPLLHFCGHIHEAPGEEMIGKTKSINIGPMNHSHMRLIELNDEVRFLNVKKKDTKKQMKLF
ncbi:MAG: metallophosphoesterase [Candidatus Diapherotrites archaeon]|nr:metallophosphoesterase [Candidatus Diapherotrites archaeon]